MPSDTFSGAGNYSYTVPSDVSLVTIEIGGAGGGGGSTFIGSVGGGGAAGAAAIGAITVAGLPLAEYLKNQITDGIRGMARNDPNTSVRPNGEGAGTPVSIATDPLSILQNVGEGITQGFANASPEFRASVLDAVTDAFASSGSVLQRTIRATGIGEDIASGVRSTLSSFDLREPRWLSDLTSFRLTEPEWLRDLTNFRLREPEWVSALTSVLGGGGGRSGPSGGPAAGARIRGSEVNANVSVDGSGLQRDLERALSRALETRDFERFVQSLVRDAIT